MTTIHINPELRDYIDPLTPQELNALEQSILREGCRDALVLWGDLLVDGHNRYAICQKHELPFQTTQNERFQSIEDVKLWMIDNHLARRSVSGFQRGVLALRKKEIVSSRRKKQQDNKAESNSDTHSMASSSREDETTAPDPIPVDTREEVAKIAGISHNAVSQIEKIRKAATPELVEAVRAGTISINAAATIASLPSEEQVVAVAGGKKELQQAARQIRQLRANATAAENDGAEKPASKVTKASLEQENITLKAENEELREQLTSLKAKLEELQNRP